MSESTTHRLVRASAGTGKTHALATRYLGLLRRGAAPESILATTFTRKAAGEILGRVLVRLAEAASTDQAVLGKEIKDPALTRRDCQDLLANLCGSLHGVTVSTIDGFFNRVATSFRYELGIPPSPRIVDERNAIIVQLRLRAIEALLADDHPRVLIDLLRRLHHDSTKRSITASIETIVTRLYEIYREAPDEAAWKQLAAPAAPTEDQRRAAHDALCDVCGEGAETVLGAQLAKALRKCREAFEQEQWESLVDQTILCSVRSGVCKYGRTALNDRVIRALRPIVEHADTMAVRRVALRGEASYDLVRRFDGHFTRLRREHGVLLFADLTHKLARELRSLGDEVWTDVYYRLDARVLHLLLDEFQDTSVTQWDVLLPLAAEITSHDDGEFTRSFFCVGDVKQAIYNWRGGCAEIFDQLPAQLNLAGGAIQRLDKSYRSSRVVLDAVNVVFRGLGDSPALVEHADAAARWAREFRDHKAAKDLSGYVELVTSNVPEGDYAAGEEGAAEEAADRTRPTPHEVYAAEKIARVHRDAPGASIGVLVSTHNAASRLLDELRKLDVDASGEGGRTITDDPAVLAVLAALTVADHPGDSIAAFHVFASPLGAIVGLASESTPDCHAAALRIRHALLDRGYAGLITGWARELATSCGPSGARRLLQLIEIADGYDATITLRSRDFVDHVRASRVEEASPSPVRVMTVHAAKGLEFDAVVLPELDRALAGMKDLPAYVERQTPVSPIRAVFAPAAEAVRSLCPRLDAAHAQMLESRLRDDLSVLYVAMTRPRQALHMIVKPLSKRKDGSAGTRGWSNLSYAAILRRALGPEGPTFAGEEILYRAGDQSWTKAFAGGRPSPLAAGVLRPALAASPAVARRAWAVVAPSSLEAGGRVRAADVLSLETSAAKVRGTILHAWFEQIEWLQDALPGDDAWIDAARDVVRSLGRDARQSADARLRPLLVEFRRMLAAPAIRGALTGGSEGVELWRERPFVVRVGGDLVRGQFDRVVVQRKGGKPVAATLIDFKSDAVSAAGLAQRVEAYRSQMESYRAALAAMLGIEAAGVTVKLLFVGPGEVVEI